MKQQMPKAEVSNKTKNAWKTEQKLNHSYLVVMEDKFEKYSNKTVELGSAFFFSQRTTKMK